MSAQVLVVVMFMLQSHTFMLACAVLFLHPGLP
jgi:hypothetical protein